MDATDAPGAYAHRFEVRASAESHFSWIRTRLSVERTLMSWVRTSVALIAAGIAGLIVSLWQYRSLLRYLNDEFEPIAGIRRIPHQTPLMAVTIALLVIGIVAFVAVLTRAV